MEKKKEILVLKIMNLEEEFRKSIDVYRNGFLLDDSIDYHKELYDNKSALDGLRYLTKKNSLFSYKYGISMNDDEETLSHLYTCDCERTIGMDNINEICPHCDTKVRRMREKTLGWFKLRHDKVFHPLLCSLLFSEGINIDGEGKVSLFMLLNKNRLEYSWEDIMWQEEDGVYTGKLFEFFNRYLKKYKDFLEIYKDPNIWFTNVIPVISKNFRFISVDKSNFDSIDDIDQHDLTPEYINISYLVNELNRDHEALITMKSKKMTKLKEIMKCINKVFIIIRKEFLDGKKAFLTQEQYSRRIGMSGRLIMLPINDERYYGIDKCVLNEDYFRSTFRKSIIKICKELKMTPIQIGRMTNQNVTLTEEERSILYNEIFPRVKSRYVYINREPAIYMTSVLMLYVVALTKENYIRVPFFILLSIAGD